MLPRIPHFLEKIRSWADFRDDHHATNQSSSRNLTLPLALEDGRVPGLISKSIYVLAGLFALGLVWACVGQIRELTVANGKIIPSGNVKLMHHLEGGVVEEVLLESIHPNTALFSETVLDMPSGYFMEQTTDFDGDNLLEPGMPGLVNGSHTSFA